MELLLERGLGDGSCPISEKESSFLSRRQGLLGPRCGKMRLTCPLGARRPVQG